MYCSPTVCVLSSCWRTAGSLATIRTAVQTFACRTSKPFVRNLNKPEDILKIKPPWRDATAGLPCIQVLKELQHQFLPLIHPQCPTVNASPCQPPLSKSLTSADVLTKCVWGGGEMAGTAYCMKYTQALGARAIINACGPQLLHQTYTRSTLSLRNVFCVSHMCR